jgi:hypothetical protein
MAIHRIDFERIFAADTLDYVVLVRSPAIDAGRSFSEDPNTRAEISRLLTSISDLKGKVQMAMNLRAEAGRMAQKQMNREEQHFPGRRRCINDGFYHQNNVTRSEYDSLGETESFMLRAY